MRRSVAAAAIAVAVFACAAAPAGASHGSDSGGSEDFAVGGGTTGTASDPTAVQHVDFAASGGPTILTSDPFSPIGGDPVTGHFRAGGAFDQLDITEFQQEGPVTCLVVDEHQARLVYPNKQATPAEPLASLEVLIFLEDHGQPVDGQPVDKIGFVLIPDETPDDDPPTEQDPECAAPPVPPPAMFTLTKGNITIHDAP